MYQKKFTLRHVIKNFSELNIEVSPVEEHFGVPWILQMEHREENFSTYLYAQVVDPEKAPWSVDAHLEFRVLSGKGLLVKSTSYKYESNVGYGFHTFRTWDDMIKNCVVDNTVTIECDVTIKSMTGIARKRTLSFENPRENLTDMVLKVGEEKFNVSRVLLATHSPYFNALFFSNFSESKKSKIELKDVDPEAFQQLLEAIHGELSVRPDNVEILLNLADRFDVKMIRKRCEEFLTSSSNMTNKNKLRIADLFNLEDVKNHCLKDVKTADDVRLLVPTDPSGMNPSTLSKLLLIAITPP